MSSELPTHVIQSQGGISNEEGKTESVDSEKVSRFDIDAAIKEM